MAKTKRPPTPRSKMGRLHDWADYAQRYIVKREWLTLRAMADSLAKWSKETGKPVPAYELICKRAMNEQWNGQRMAWEASTKQRAAELAVSQEAENLVSMYHKFRKAGGYTFALGGNWIAEIEKLRAKDLEEGRLPRPGAITTLYEALSAMRVGATIEKLATEGLLSSKGGDKKEEIDKSANAETPVNVQIFLPDNGRKRIVDA